MIRVAFIIGAYPPEERRLREETAKSFSSSEVEVGIVSVAPSPFGGLGPAEISLVAPYYHAAYLQAEREGYDAAVPLGTLDLGVDGGRSLVDIPVVGPCEAMFHVAAQLGATIRHYLLPRFRHPTANHPDALLWHGAMDRRPPRLGVQAQGYRHQQRNHEAEFLGCRTYLDRGGWRRR